MSKFSELQAAFLKKYLGYRPLGDGEDEPEESAKSGACPVSPEENDRLEGLTPQELVKTNLTQTDMTKLFGRPYMETLKDIEIKGVGDPKLKDLMREIEKGVAGPRRIEVMEALARIVGVPPSADKLDVDYGRFLVVQKQQKVIGISKDDTADTLDEEKHPDFRASRGQLLFGKVLGDAFGIHEVFAALLSPTGGLVGPGNWLIPGLVDAGHLDPDNPVALHGCVHDAAGYLLTFHDQGPGYNYLESNLEILGKNSPLSGQISGIVYWTAEAGDEYILRRVDAVVVEMEKKLKSVRDAVASKINGLIGAFRKKAKQVVENAEAAADEALDVAEAIEDAVERVEASAIETAQAATDSLGDHAAKGAKDKLGAAKNLIWS